MPQAPQKKPAEEFVAKHWTIIDGKKVDLPPVVFRRQTRAVGKKRKK
jgi:hypothetical protein